jgi:two-component system response regulator ResD
MKRILVIDDSPFVIDSVREALEPDGISVDGLTDLAQFDGVGDLDAFDLILCDVGMPPLRGDQVAAAVRRRGGFSAPVVLMSSLPEAQLAARTREAGLDGYILKLRSVEEVISDIRAWLDGRPHRDAGR